jgi:hypothetical protein
MPSAKMTSCKPLPSTDPLGAHLDHFRIVASLVVGNKEAMATADVYDDAGNFVYEGKQ